MYTSPTGSPFIFFATDAAFALRVNKILWNNWENPCHMRGVRHYWWYSDSRIDRAENVCDEALTAGLRDDQFTASSYSDESSKPSEAKKGRGTYSSLQCHHLHFSAIPKVLLRLPWCAHAMRTYSGDINFVNSTIVQMTLLTRTVRSQLRLIYQPSAADWHLSNAITISAGWLADWWDREPYLQVDFEAIYDVTALEFDATRRGFYTTSLRYDATSGLVWLQRTIKNSIQYS